MSKSAETIKVVIRFKGGEKLTDKEKESWTFKNDYT